MVNNEKVKAFSLRESITNVSRLDFGVCAGNNGGTIRMIEQAGLTLTATFILMF